MKTKLGLSDFFDMEAIEYAYEKKKSDRYLLSTLVLVTIGATIAFGTLCRLQRLERRRLAVDLASELDAAIPTPSDL